MISRYFEARGGASFPTSASSQAVRRPDAIGMFQPFAGLLLAAGFVISLAGRYEAQLIRAERVQQEVVGR